MRLRNSDVSPEKKLSEYAYNTRNDNLHFIEYRLLRRLNIFNLQNKLAAIKVLSQRHHQLTDAELLELQETLHAYSKPCYISFCHLI